MRYKITHTTTYAYSDMVAVCQNVVRLTPRNGPHQRCVAHKLAIKPRPDIVDRRLDYFGNQVHNFAIAEGHNRMVVKAVSRVEVLPPGLPAANDSPAWESVRDALKTDITPAGLDARQFVFESPFIP
ncbi:MAG: transglutaminase N-terminal domain-containing protein, partial [Bradyrhizobium sp.]